MVDWGSALKLFASGIVGVMVVMISLQITVQLSTSLIRLVENRNNQARQNKSV